MQVPHAFGIYCLHALNNNYVTHPFLPGVPNCEINDAWCANAHIDSINVLTYIHTQRELVGDLRRAITSTP